MIGYLAKCNIRSVKEEEPKMILVLIVMWRMEEE